MKKMGNNMNLYDINTELQLLINNVQIDEIGEVPEEFSVQLEQLKISKQEKAIHCARSIKNLSADYEAIHNEIDKLEERAERIKNIVEKIKRYISTTCLGEEFKDATAEICWRKSASVIIDDFNLLPPNFLRVVPETVAPDKTVIKLALKTQNVPGAHLEEKLNLQIK
jgi:hypothetical protein